MIRSPESSARTAETVDFPVPTERTKDVSMPSAPSPSADRDARSVCADPAPQSGVAAEPDHRDSGIRRRAAADLDIVGPEGLDRFGGEGRHTEHLVEHRIAETDHPTPRAHAIIRGSDR